MADRVLFISWGQTVRGAEERAVEVFNDALGILGRAQQDGRIERFDVVLMDPNTHLDGYIEVFGTTEQLVALQESEEFIRNTIDAQLAVDGISHVMGHCNEGVARMMGLYHDAVAKVPQRA